MFVVFDNAVIAPYDVIGLALRGNKQNFKA
jgi:hypothetical protein